MPSSASQSPLPCSLSRARSSPFGSLSVSRPNPTTRPASPLGFFLVLCQLCRIVSARTRVSTPVSSPSPSHAMPNPRGLCQAYDLRDFAASEALALKDVPVSDPEDRYARARALRDLASVWETASDRIRLLRGRPLPGSLRPERKSKPKRHAPVAPLSRVAPEPSAPALPKEPTGIAAPPLSP
jgi:hypothetical protein